jgi:hypothetical protein
MCEQHVISKRLGAKNMRMQQAYDYRLPWHYRANMEDRNKSVLLFHLHRLHEFHRYSGKLSTAQNGGIIVSHCDATLHLWTKKLEFNLVYVIFGNDS